MADHLTHIVAFCSRRYNENSASRPRLANAHLVIVNFAKDLPIGSAGPERHLLDFLSQPHSDPELREACQEALEHIGAASQ